MEREVMTFDDVTRGKILSSDHCLNLLTEYTFFIIKPTRWTNLSNLILDWKSTCFWQFLYPSSGVFHCTHSNGICHTVLLTACEEDHPDPARKPVWLIPLLCVQWKTPDDGQRNCQKHVDFQSKNKFEKLVHFFGFIIRNLSQCTVTWMSKRECTAVFISKWREKFRESL
jgi:hypothetical protein